MNPPVTQQAGAVVYRRDPEELQILVVRARRNPADWIFPKGHVEEGEAPAATALREVEEEAGVTGRVVADLQTPVTFAQGGRTVRVEYFLLEYNGEVAPSEQRERAWLPPEEALALLTHETTRAVLRRALEQLD